MGDIIAPGIRISSGPTDTGLVLLTINVDGYREVTIPVSAAFAIEVALDLYRSGSSAAQYANDRDAVFNRLRRKVTSAPQLDEDELF